MSDDLRQLIDVAIKLELSMAEIYHSFYKRFPEDADFWRKIVVEERKHAALLDDWKQHLLDTAMFPVELMDTSSAAINNLNNEIESILRRESEDPPVRAAAFKLAIMLEESAGEAHFQHVLQQVEPSSKAIRLFRRLHEADVDHADRLRNYMHQNGLEMACN